MEKKRRRRIWNTWKVEILKWMSKPDCNEKWMFLSEWTGKNWHEEKKNYNKENMYSNWKKMSKWSGKYTYTLNTRISVNWRKNVEIFYEYSNIRLKLRVVLSFLENAKCYRALMCHILILLHRSMLVSWLVLCAMLPYLLGFIIYPFGGEKARLSFFASTNSQWYETRNDKVMMYRFWHSIAAISIRYKW